ncbi:cyclic pyranopterin monophosphate synthase MoaC [Microbacterium sp. bgisy203]|uniref:cyclic pyranopterin monophosphate synthase MoaC n=1 Tax=Microbacterium sp. bgisy203 TaxID=3413799 RepID=UPI003D7154D0
MSENDRGSEPALTHVREDGAVHMVDVSAKQATVRTARASAVVVTTPETVALVATGDLPKGEALATARIAGILAAKQTPQLIPLCHPLPLSAVEVSFALTPEEGRIGIETFVKTTAPTGVEMEALTAASVAALTVFDMIKAVDATAVIEGIRVVEKRGGKSDIGGGA